MLLGAWFHSRSSAALPMRIRGAAPGASVRGRFRAVELESKAGSAEGGGLVCDCLRQEHAHWARPGG